MTLVISKGEAGEGALENFRELLGPTNVDEAKDSAPERYIHVCLHQVSTWWVKCT